MKKWKKTFIELKELAQKNSVISGILILLTIGITSKAIIDGRDAGEEEFPQVFAIRNYMNSPQYSGSWNCSSFLVAPQLLLTAAHCLYHNQVRLGDAWNGVNVNRRKSKRGLQAFPLRYSAHPNYVMPEKGKKTDMKNVLKNASYDIAFIVLNQPVNLPLYSIIPDLTAEDTFSLIGQKATLVGYGPNDIEMVKDPENNFSEYGNKRVGLKPITAVQANTIVLEGSDQSALPGDSGGPVFFKMNGKLVLAGIMSQFQKDEDNNYKMLTANLLRNEVVCWAEKTSGIDIPSVNCP